jgi:hypothetical protein
LRDEVYHAAGEKQIWAGGQSFVAEIDPSRARVTRIADLGRVWAHGIAVSQSDLWIAAGNQLFRVPRPNEFRFFRTLPVPSGLI